MEIKPGSETDTERMCQAKDGDVLVVSAEFVEAGCPTDFRLAQLEKIAELAVELFRPPWRGCASVRLPSTDKTQDQRMDVLSEALVEAGFGWGEWT